MSLPIEWVDRIFTKLTVVYGQEFLARWRDIDINAVKSDWMHELSGYENYPSAIRFALSNLPVKAPSILDFKSLLRMAPAAPVLALPEPAANPDLVKLELKKLEPLRGKPVAGHMAIRGGWAQLIVQRRLNGGETITPTQHRMAINAIEALGINMPHQAAHQ